MANDVVINVRGRDQGAKATMDQSTTQASKLAGALDNIGKIVGGTFLGELAQSGFNKLNSFMAESIDLAKEQARVEAQLDAVIRSTGGAAGFTADEIKKMASEYQAVTNFGDEAVISSSNVLMTFTSIGRDVFPRAQAAILDVSTALGQDLQQSTIQIGKALNNPIEGLTNLARAGIQFTEQQKEQIRTMVEAGDLAGAQTMILEELEKQFAGSAEAAVEADGGITQMNNSIGDMQEEIGAKLIPVMLKWTQMKLQLLEAFTSLPGPMQVTIGLLAVLTLGFATLAPKVIAAKAALDQMGATARNFTLRAGGVVTLITALVTLLTAFKQETVGSQVEMSQLAEDLDRFNRTGRVTGEMWDLFGEKSEFFQEKLEQATSTVGRADDGFSKFVESIGLGVREAEDARDRFVALDEGLAELVNQGADADEILQRLAETYGLNEQQVQDLLSVLPNFNEAVERETERQHDAREATVAHTTSLQELAEQMREQLDPTFRLIGAQEDLREAQKAVTKAEKEHGKNSPEYRRALRDEAQAAMAVLAAAGELGDEFTGDLSKAQKRMLRDAGLSEEAIEQLAKDLRKAKRDADKLDGTRVDLQVNTHFTQTGRPPIINGRPPGGHFAAGGVTGGEFDAEAQAGGPRGSRVLVGEHRPEILELPFGTRVIPSVQQAFDRNQIAAGIGGGGGGVTVNLFVQGSIRSDRELIQLIRDEFLNGGFRGILEGIPT